MPELRISVKSNLREVASWLTDLEKQQLPFATSKALNDTAFDAMNDVRAEVRKVFQAPTPWVLRQIRYKKSTKHKLEAYVGFADKMGFIDRTPPVGHIMQPHMDGGVRGPNATELHLRRAGILAGDEFLVPGKDMRRNAYGNVSQGIWQKMLSGLRAHPDVYARSHGAKAAQWFMGRVNGRKVIFYRKSRHVLMIAFIVVKRPSYKKRFDLSRTVNKVVARRFNRHFAKAMDYALRTAR